MDSVLVADQEELSLTWVKYRVFRVDYLHACSLSRGLSMWFLAGLL
jgi:hypothetical protein